MRDFINIIESAAAADASLLPEIITRIRQSYNDRGISTREIGNGHCEDFARDVQEEWLGDGWLDNSGENGFQEVETGNFCTHVGKWNDEPDDWDWKLLAQHWNIKPPLGYSKNALRGLARECPNHVWIATGGKHYDAESPNGEDSFFDLMFFKRWLQSTKTISEGWDSAYRIDAERGPQDVDLYINPDRKEFSKLFHDHPHGLRGVITHGGDLLVWDAYIAYHSDIERVLDKAGRQTIGAWILLYPTHVDLNDAQMDCNDHDEPGLEQFQFARYLTRKIAATRSCESLRRFYGPDMLLHAVDNDTGVNHVVTDDWIEQNCCPVND